MTIVSEISRIQGNIADAYDALEAKGATMPATENSANLASTVNTITGGTVASRYGCSLDSLLPAFDSFGALNKGTSPTALDFTGVKSLGSMALYEAFSRFSGIQSVAFPDLETIGSRGLYGTFAYPGTGSLTSVSFPKLTTVGQYGMYRTFQGNSYLASASFPELQSVSLENNFYRCFYQCSSLTSIEFPKLSSLATSGSFNGCFFACTSLTSLSFPALTSTSFGSYTDQFHNMLLQVTGCTVHFPSNLQSVIGSWSDVTNGFGGTNTTVLFDLSATS